MNGGRAQGLDVIAWDEAGSGPTIVFVHGLSEDRHSWDPVVPLLEDAFRCVRLDLRGHGASGDADDLSALAMAADVATVVTEARIDQPPVLVGHSLGGMVATVYAATAPVRSVVNVDQPLAMGGFAATLHALAPKLRGTEVEFREALQSVFAALGVDRIPAPWRAWADAKHAAARQDVVLGVWDLVLDSQPSDLDALVAPMLAAIDVPYLSIHGDDPGDGYADWLTEHVPSAVVEVWAGDGHYPHLVEPDRFAARVRSFAST